MKFFTLFFAAACALCMLFSGHVAAAPKPAAEAEPGLLNLVSLVDSLVNSILSIFLPKGKVHKACPCYEDHSKRICETWGYGSQYCVQSSYDKAYCWAYQKDDCYKNPKWTPAHPWDYYVS